MKKTILNFLEAPIYCIILAFDYFITDISAFWCVVEIGVLLNFAGMPSRFQQ